MDREMTSQNTRLLKKELREQCKGFRKLLTPEQRQEKDTEIIRKLLSMPVYLRAQTVLCYASTAEEINTHTLIEQMVSDGKRVCVPYCIDGTRQMDFYAIRSVEELVLRSFGIFEPDPGKHEKLAMFEHTICIAPGLAYDRQGYRLGYGGGYYDRFLSKNKLDACVGVCYHECLFPEIIRGCYDLPCDYVVTEVEIMKTAGRASE